MCQGQILDPDQFLIMTSSGLQHGKDCFALRTPSDVICLLVSGHKWPICRLTFVAQAPCGTMTPGQFDFFNPEEDTMCGRFVGFRKLEELKHYFPIDRSDCEAAANYNVAPTQEILAIARLDGANVLDKYHWGLVPFWARDTAVGYKMINARSETVATKPGFREAFRKRRCLIPADGFYEWKGKKGNKQPMFITTPDASPFAFAGLWETWHDGHGPGAAYRSCTILTRDAVGAVRELHHRMPVILRPDAYGPWLDPDNSDPDALSAILQTRALADLVFYPVGRQVNAVRNNESSNIKPVQTEFEF
jgi:putative SOS response-associated peptidase YedK